MLSLGTDHSCDIYGGGGGGDKISSQHSSVARYIFTMTRACTIYIFFSFFFCSIYTKLVRSRWLYIGLVLFLRFYGPRLRLGQTEIILNI